jgi:hypothetical protein
MPWIFSTPVDRSAVASGHIGHFGLRINYDVSGLPTGARFGYTLETFDASGNKIQDQFLSRQWSDIPPAVQDHLRAVRDACLADARNRGALPDGTAENEL